MAFVISDFQDFLTLLRAHPEWREELRPLILGEEVMRTPALLQQTIAVLALVGERLDALTIKVEALAEQQRITGERLDALTVKIEALTVKVDALAEQQRITGERIDALAEQQRVTGERIDALAEQQRISGERIDALAEQLSANILRIDSRMGRMEGDSLELKYLMHARPAFGKWIRRGDVISAEDLDEVETAEASGLLTPEEVDRLVSVDIMVVGSEKRAQPPRSLIMAAEISATISNYDVDRAHLAAELLKRVGLNAKGLVGGYFINERTREHADELGVVVDLRRLPDRLAGYASA